ncbi:MAG: hypothetical protein MGF17_03090 [Trichodesmium sp. MAG_R04]|nr:hypothetical protein [Trichodesmium sp. MAG_R04]
MEITNFLTWFICIGLIASVGIGTMIYAYRGQGTISVLFTQPISISLEAEAAVNFQQGCEAFQVGNYQQAIKKFTEVIQNNSNIVQAYHNRGLAFANLRQDDESVANLLQAAELYLQEGNQPAIAIVKKNLELLKARKDSKKTVT